MNARRQKLVKKNPYLPLLSPPFYPLSILFLPDILQAGFELLFGGGEGAAVALERLGKHPGGICGMGVDVGG
jgi:hypothetical protein